MQLWIEINVVTLHKVVETMPQQMRSVIKAKGGLLQKASVQLFFWTGSVYSACLGSNLQFSLSFSLSLSLPPSPSSACL